MPSLSALTRSFGDRLDAIRRETAAVVVPRMGGTSHRVTMQLAEAASDIEAAGRTLAEAHRRAIRVFHAEERGGPPIPANRGARTLLAQPPELAALSVLIKAWLFFVRAFCDNAYRLLLADAEHRPAPRGASMESILNAGNPVATMFATQAPGLSDWFRNLRAIRNEMKEGAAFAFSRLDARGLALTIFEIRTERSSFPEIDLVEGRTVAFADVVEDAGWILQILGVLSAVHRSEED